MSLKICETCGYCIDMSTIESLKEHIFRDERHRQAVHEQAVKIRESNWWNRPVDVSLLWTYFGMEIMKKNRDLQTDGSVPQK